MMMMEDWDERKFFFFNNPTVDVRQTAEVSLNNPSSAPDWQPVDTETATTAFILLKEKQEKVKILC